MTTPVNLQAQYQLPTAGIDWARYGFGPGQRFFGNLAPPIPTTTDAVKTTEDGAVTQLRNQATSAGDQSGHSNGSAPGGSVSNPFSPGTYATGTMASLLGSAVPLPGMGTLAGAAGTAYDVSRVNNDLSSIGLKGDLSMVDGLLGNASFGLLGETPQSYFDLMTAGVPFGVLQQIAGVPVTAPLVSQSSGMPGVQTTGSAGLDFGNAINDMNNVGRLGDVLNELDRQRDEMNNGGGAGTGNSQSNETHAAQAEAQSPDNPGGMWRHGGPVGKRTAASKTRPVRGTVHTGEWVHKPETRNAYGDKVMKAMDQQKIPPKKLRALV